MSIIKYFQHYRSETIQSLIETLILTLLVLGGLYYFFPKDPFLLDGAFPWIWLLPLVLGLHHSFSAGMLSYVAAVIFFYYIYGDFLFNNPFYKEYLFGGFLIAFLAGQFTSVKLIRLRRAFEKHDYDRKVLRSLINDYYVIRYSHDCLEQNNIVKPINLRSSLLEIRNIFIKEGGEFNKNTADRVLQLLSHYCSFTKASFYQVVNDEVNKSPLVFMGEKTQCKVDNFLVKKALKTKKTCCIAEENIEKVINADYLVVAPMVNSSKECIGLLTIEEMPFLSLTEETLVALSIILTFIANDITSTQAAPEILEAYPDCPPLFAKELCVLSDLNLIINVKSSIAMFDIQALSFQKDAIIDNISKCQHSLDLIWIRNNKIYILMPFTDKLQLNMYFQRKKAEFLDKFKIKLNSDNVTFAGTVISGDDPLNFLKNFISNHEQ